MEKYPECNTGETFVQLLTIIRPCADYPTGKILLCKWQSGDFKDRYTGLWGKLQPESDGQDVRSTLLRLADCSESDYLPGTMWEKEQLELMAAFGFDVPVPNLEYIFVLDLPATTSINTSSSMSVKETGKKTEDIKYVGSPDSWRSEWFDLDKIPFDRMPADDALWYDLVIHGQKLTGNFLFAGEPKHTLKHYKLNKVHSLDLPEITARSPFDQPNEII